ncbi:hypothetical protein V1477_007546 [Vespula maculifrons]|uniref:Uncharacterized protein n=1 Tax=Vespula maculifrons TaxID=7453 RepID=A0ABD2CJW4_VESMC
MESRVEGTQQLEKTKLEFSYPRISLNSSLAEADPASSVIGREMSAGCGRIWQVELLNSLNWSGVCYRGIGRS